MPDDSLAVIAFEGNKLYSAERYKEAENTYRRGIALHPNEPLLQRNLAFCLLMQKRYGDAAIAFRGYLSRVENDAEAHHGLATALFNCALTAGNPEVRKEALREIETAIKLAPTDITKPDDLARFYWEWNELELSYSVMLTVITRAAYDENRIHDFIKIVEFLKVQQRAIATLEEQQKANGGLEYLLAHVHKSAGNEQKASEHLASAAMRYPWLYKIWNKQNLFASDIST